MSTSSPEDDLLTDLHAFAVVAPNGKVSVFNEYITHQPPSSLRWIQRTLLGDSRKKTVDKLKKVVDYSIEFCTSHIDYLHVASASNDINNSRISTIAKIEHKESKKNKKNKNSNKSNKECKDGLNESNVSDTKSTFQKINIGIGPASETQSKCHERYNRLNILNNAMKDALDGISNLEQTYLPSVASQINVRLKKLKKQVEINDRELAFYKYIQNKLHDSNDSHKLLI